MRLKLRATIWNGGLLQGGTAKTHSYPYAHARTEAAALACWGRVCCEQCTRAPSRQKSGVPGCSCSCIFSRARQVDGLQAADDVDESCAVETAAGGAADDGAGARVGGVWACPSLRVFSRQSLRVGSTRVLARARRSECPSQMLG